jgi:hypothetical protein
MYNAISPRAISTIPISVVFIRRIAAIFENAKLSTVNLSTITNKNNIVEMSVIKNQKYQTSLSGNILNDVSELIAS